MDILDIFAYTALVLSMLWAHLRIVRRQEPGTRVTCMLLLDGLALLTVALGIFWPQVFIAFMQEDHIGEWVTFYAFGFTGVIIVAHLWFFRAKQQRLFSLYGIISLSVAAFCLVVAGEEISWGQRIFAFKPPDFFLETNYQQELNVHNLFMKGGIWGIVIESKYQVMLVAFAYGVLFPVIVHDVTFFRHVKRLPPGLHLMPYFILVIVMLQIYPIRFAGEACEMYLGLIFLFHTFDAYPLSPERGELWRRLSRPAGLTGLVFLLGMLTAPLLDLTIYGFDDAIESQIKNELSLLQQDLLSPDASTDKMPMRKGIHKRVYTAIAQNYIRMPAKSRFLEDRAHGSGLKKDSAGKDRKDYFLDPWNNPYWVFYSRKGDFIVLYSFGPNRKRDSILFIDPVIVPDDLGVIFRRK